MNFDRLRNLLTRETAWRFLASLALALILWALVTMREDPETSRAFTDVPVQALSLDPSLVLREEIAPVRVELSGPESDVTPIESNSVVASVDFTGIQEPGTYQLPVALKVPDGVWRSDVSPPTATIDVELSASKPFRLAPMVTGLDENSLRVVTVYPEVEQVTVSGPSSLVESVATVILPVEVAGGTQTFTEVYVPQAHDEDGNVVDGVTIDPAAVTANVRVSARGKSVAVLASITGVPAPGYEVAARTINPQFVIVDGDKAALDSLVALTTEPVDVSGADTSFGRTVGIADLPEGLQILQPSSGEVEVLVQIAQRGVRQTLPSQQVSIVGLGPGLVGQATPNEITIDVVAPEDALAELDSSTLKIVIDASGLGPGTYAVQPSVIMPPHVQWVASFPTEVTLTITQADDSSPPSASPVGNEAGITP